ncbi:hypothetical protein [Paenibacillus odorifer]|uniref:hypothetical protein n=2 Tax=Paenibacillus TaxID=44249 RepID=UPI0014701484|nr:hypothetical protein [Paenibacillus odorifer]
MNDGLTYTTQEFADNELHSDADFLTVSINGKKNNSTLNFDGKVYRYDQLTSIEIIFV